MNKTVLALAALVAFSGAAFAGEAVKSQQASPAVCMETTAKTKLDCASTGSIEKTHSAVDAGKADGKGPRLGIDIDPWIVPSTF